MLRQIPMHLREAFKRVNNQPVWFDRVWLTSVYLFFIAAGMLLGTLWSNHRHEAYVRDLAIVTQEVMKSADQCILTLYGMASAAIIIEHRAQRRTWQASQPGPRPSQ